MQLYLFETLGFIIINSLNKKREESQAGTIDPESLAMVLAKFLPDRSTPIKSKSHSPMKNTAKTISPAFFKLCLQINDLQSSLMFRAMARLRLVFCLYCNHNSSLA